MRRLNIEKRITPRTEASLEKYLNDIGRESRITREEEVILAKKIKEGDQNAIDKLTKANLKFVVSVAKQYQNRGSSLPDLINEGNIGLIKAAKRFDETRGFKFISYAVWWIRQSILESINENSTIISRPGNIKNAFNKIKKIQDNFEKYHSREPTMQEIEEIFRPKKGEKKTTKKKSKSQKVSVDQIIQVSSKHVSLDAPANEDGESFVSYLKDSHNTLPDYSMINQALSFEIDRSLSTLEEREREVIKLFFGVGVESSLSLEEIGEKFDLTRERIRQIKEKALKHLKQKSRSYLLKEYLG